MAGFNIKLVPDDAIPKKAAGASQLTPGSAVPKFGRPQILVPDDFWSNLRQFLFERPVKIRGDYHSPLMPEEYGGGFFNNLRDFFSSKPVPKGSTSGLSSRWSRGASFGGFGSRLKELFVPEKQAPLPFEVRPVKVREIWSKRENFGVTQIASIAVHGVVAALIVAAFLIRISPSTQAVNKDANVMPIDISDYISKLPAGANKAGGGGGANDHTLTPVNKGKLPKFKMTQFAAPQVHPMPNPKLAMDATLLGPPDLKVASPNLPNFGDPLANGNSDSLGHGNGTGIGSGTGGGLGPGEGGGTGGGAFRAGVNGVGVPTCYYHPDPPYSEEARKAKYQGIVVVEAIIETDDRVTNLRVVKSPGLGLDEKTLETVRTWRCKAASGPNGKPVRTSVPIEVSFRLF